MSAKSFKNKKVMISAGGTGGHIYPALATAKSLRDAGAQIVWIGTPVGPEGEISQNHDIDFHAINVEGVRGKGVKTLLNAPFKVLNAILSSQKVVRQCQPDVFLGFGGFVTGPAGVAARLCGVPVVIHEQNAIPGLTNKLLRYISTETLVAFPIDKWPKAKVVGNPIRQDISTVQKVPREEGLIRITVIGGSLGAQSINHIVPKVATKLENVFIRHQTGIKNYEDTLAAYEKMTDDVHIDMEILPYIDDMAKTYANTDLLIARAGALTVSEAASAGVPAIFIPLPSAVDNHQLFNAKFSEGNQAAVIIEQSELTVDYLTSSIKKLIDSEKLIKMAINAKKMSHENALLKVINQLYDITQKSKNKKITKTK